MTMAVNGNDLRYGCEVSICMVIARAWMMRADDARALHVLANDVALEVK